MKKIYFVGLITILVACGQSTKEELATRKTIKLAPYPETRKDSVVDNYFGKKVKDPYRWLENDTSMETSQWVTAQNKVTFDYLNQIPYRDKVKKRLTKLWNYEKQGSPFKKGKFYFFYKNDGIQNQSVLYYQKGINGKAEVLLDPNQLSTDGTASINGIGFSKNAQYMAYGLSYAGSDWVEIQVLNLENKKALKDTIRYVKFSSINWFKDGFYYSAYEPPSEGSDYSGKNEYHSVYYHKLGSPQADDQLVYRDEEHPLRNANAGVTEDEKYLYINTSESTNGNGLLIKNLEEDAPFIEVVKHFDNDNRILDHLGDGKFLIQTNYEAPKGQICILDLEQPSQENWKTLIAEKEAVIDAVSLAGDKIVVNYMKDVKSKLEVYNRDGEYIQDIDLPGIGIAKFRGNQKTNLAFYSFSSYTYPNTIFKYDLDNNRSSLHFKPQTDFKSDRFVSKQVFYESKDGTKIPMIITHKKGLDKNGKNPTFLYGYGGFDISITPSYAAKNAVFLEQGGIYAVANLRGGSEYGEKWHKAGWRYNKQNVFDDFIAAAEYLIDSNYTSSKKLAIHGRSNGGLLVGAVMTQRPNLMNVAIPSVGVLDMLRYHKFTIGWAWSGEYGNSEESKKSFENLYAYSPLHNLEDTVAYPATMVTTADHDDRVVPAHSFKFIASLQEKHAGDAPVLIRIDVDAGHGAGKPTAKQIDEWSDIWSFVLWNTKAKTNF